MLIRPGRLGQFAKMKKPKPIAGITTPGGVILPPGWNHLRTDTFGSAGSIPSAAALHALYWEGLYFDRDYLGNQVSNPINGQQQTYQHFEDATFNYAAGTDHMAIQVRGQPDNSIKSGQICSKWSDRSVVFEARYQTPNFPGHWSEQWVYSNLNGDSSELDVEIVVGVTANTQDTHQVYMGNHPLQDMTAEYVANADLISLQYGEYKNAAYDTSTAPHYYTVMYDDSGSGTIMRWIDGQLMYVAPNWKWAASLGGTGFGPDAIFALDVAVGGSWPGNVASPSTVSGDFLLYSVGYYTKRAIPAGCVWDQSIKSGGVFLSDDYLTAYKRELNNGENETVFGRVPISSGLVYWEVTVVGAPGETSANLGVGPGIGAVGASCQPARYLGQDANTMGWFSTGKIVSNNANYAFVPGFNPGDRLCFALDPAVGHTLQGRVGPNGQWWSVGLAAALQANVLPASNITNSGESIIGHFAPSTWLGTPPSGYGAWPSS